MGEAQKGLFRTSFNRAVHVESRAEHLTGNAGVVLLREVDERLQLTTWIGGRLVDRRRPDLVRYQAVELLRQRLYAVAQGYTCQDACDVLAHDGALQVASWSGGGEAALGERLASQPTHSRFVDTLARSDNRAVLRQALGQSLQRFQQASGHGRKLRRATVDVDSTEWPVSGHQAGAQYNGYYGQVVYHPLVASLAPGGNYDGGRPGAGFVHALLRRGQASGAEGALRFIRTAVATSRKLAQQVDVRMDAGFTHGAILDGLTRDGIRFIGRLGNNPVVTARLEPHLVRRVGRPPAQGYEYVVELGSYQAQSWHSPQRLIGVVVDRPNPQSGCLNLWPHAFVLVTNWSRTERSAPELLEHYRQRGTFEDRLSEIKGTVRMALSSPAFEENEAQWLLALLAHNLAGMVREVLEAATGQGWDLGRVRDVVLKVPGRLLRHARKVLLVVPHAVAPLWQSLWQTLQRWRTVPRRDTPRRQRRWHPPPAHAHRRLMWGL